MCLTRMKPEINTNHKIEILSDTERARLTARKAVMLEAANRHLQAGYGHREAMLFIDDALSSARELGETDFSFANEYIQNALPIAIINLNKEVSLYDSVRSDMLLSKIHLSRTRLPLWAEVAGIDISKDLAIIQDRLKQILIPSPSWWRRLFPQLSS